MNVQEFSKLEKGDKIENALNGSKGEVSRTSDSGVYVVWGARSDFEREFFYGVAGTTWFNWSRAEDGEVKAQ